MSAFTPYTNEFLSDPPELYPEYHAELTLGEEDRSLDVDADRPHLVRLYEKLGALTPHAPYFTARLAELFWRMRAVPLAAAYFKKAQSQLSDLLLEDEPVDPLLRENVAMTSREVAMNLLNLSQLRVEYSQPWKEAVAHRFPADLAIPAEHDKLRSRWAALSPAARRRCWELMAIDTNELEKAFSLTEESKRDLITRGIDAGTISPRPESDIQDPMKILDVLRDTLAAFNILEDIVAHSRPITQSLIEELHARVLATARFSEDGGYVAAGVLRNVTKQTVVIGTAAGPIQCCPHERIESEIAYFCRALQDHMAKHQNAFALASWIHLVFGRCHPFEDGNGRVTRMLASYPLLKQGYPPVSLGRKDTPTYFSALNKANDGDHAPLVACFAHGTHSTRADKEFEAHKWRPEQLAASELTAKCAERNYLHPESLLQGESLRRSPYW